MPSVYAHKKFGAMIYKSLPRDVKDIIADNKECFLAGLHGPDVLFFHKFGINPELSDIGKQIHKDKFVKWYEKAIEVLNEDYDDEKLSYFLGCICHYMCDSACHPIVRKAVAETGMTHGKIEIELDRYAMKQDAKDPFKYPAAAHLAILPEVAVAAAPFYQGITDGEFLAALAAMKGSYIVCEINNDGVRNMLCKVMAKTGNEKKIASLILSKQESQMAMKYVKQLYAKMNGIIDETVEEVVKFARYYDDVIIASERLNQDFYGI